MEIAIGADHLGFALKESLAIHLAASGHTLTDFSRPGPDPVDYPDVAVPVAQAVAAGKFDRAVLICGTGVGMAIAANKVPGVRAANVSDPYSAERARRSNNAQVLCLGSLVLGTEVARFLVDLWLAAEFAGGGSARKVAKINALDESRGNRASDAQPQPVKVEAGR